MIAALLQKEPGEFVRAPKLGTLAERGGEACRPSGEPLAAQAYRSRLRSGCVLEIALGVWAAAAFAVYVGQYEFAVGAVLLLHAGGFLAVGIVSLVHGRPSTVASPPVSLRAVPRCSISPGRD